MEDERSAIDGDDVDWSQAELLDDDGPSDGSIDPKDAMLNLFVRYAESGIGVGVTLLTPAGIITGTITSTKAFTDLNRDLVASGSGDDNIRKALAEAFQIMSDHARDNRLEADQNTPTYRFIHLSEAKVMAPGAPAMPAVGMMTRIAIDDVTGWSLGQLQ